LDPGGISTADAQNTGNLGSRGTFIKNTKVRNI
jgi:hypothetical protein